MRVRNFTQDDAHIFCTEAQMQDEVSRFIDLLYEVYKDFGFDEVLLKLSTRPAKRVAAMRFGIARGSTGKKLNNKGSSSGSYYPARGVLWPQNRVLFEGLYWKGMAVWQHSGGFFDAGSVECTIRV